MNETNERHGATAAADAADGTGFEFVVDGATISVAFGGKEAARGPSLEKAKLAIARLASLQEAELARQSQARQKQPGVREMPNVFDYWAYRRD